MSKTSVFAGIISILAVGLLNFVPGFGVTSALAQGSCALQSSTTTFDKYDLKELAKQGYTCLFVNSDRFDKYDLKDLGAAGVDLFISVQYTRLDKYDIKDIASKPRRS